LAETSCRWVKRLSGRVFGLRLNLLLGKSNLGLMGLSDLRTSLEKTLSNFLFGFSLGSHLGHCSKSIRNLFEI